MVGRKIFGLDISDHSLEALILAKPLFGVPKVVSYSRLIVRGEVVKNGIIKKPDKLAENITQLLKTAQPKPIRESYCILSLPESQVFTAIFKLPAGLRHEEVKNTIPYKAEEVIPFKSSEIYFDFKTITTEGPTQEVFYAAVPVKVVDSYIQVLASLGLKPIAFDLESISLARALLGPSQKSDKAKLLMDIGARTTNLNIFDRNGIRQSLTIKIAGDRFAKAIAKSLNISEKEAGKLKRDNGFDPQKQKGKVLLVLQNEFKRIIAEAKKLIDFYQTQNQRKIDEVILVGGSALLPKVDQYLADNLELKVNIGNPFKKIADPFRLTGLKSKAVLFSNVIGLALRGVGKRPSSGDINLLPVAVRRFSLKPAKEEKEAWKAIYIRLAIFAFLILIFILLFVGRQSGLDLYQKVFPTPFYKTFFTSEVDPTELEKYRQPPPSVPVEVEEVKPQIKVKIKQTGMGYLNIRNGPGTSYQKIGEALTGQEYFVLEQKDDWFQIELDQETTGWVYSVYVDKLE